jgi:serine/threonine-protein kinase RsbW
MVETFACSFQATELDARTGIGDVVGHLRRLGLNETRAGEVQIALAEAVNNVVEHAYAGSAPGDVRIRCNLDNDRLWISIWDAGMPLPDNKLPLGKPADISGPVEDLPEGGFGWFLIRELTSDIQYQREDGSNELSMCFEIELKNS